MLIGLTGKLGSGKDTTFEFIEDIVNFSTLSQLEGRKVVRDAFADRLKISAARALGFEGEDFECIMFCNDLKAAGSVVVMWDDEAVETQTNTDHWAEWGITGREFLQLYGTEAHRDVFDQDFWVNAVLPDPVAGDYGRGDGLTREDILVITDVRFDNEARRVREFGGYLWEIQRGDRDTGDHASEAGIDPELITHTVPNNGTLEDLYDYIRALLPAVVSLHEQYEVQV